MGNNYAVQALLKHHNYKLRPTAPDSSNQNPLAECPMQTINNGMRALLDSNGLGSKFWPYTFYHYICILSWLLRSNQTVSPYKIIMKVNPDLSSVCTFGSPYAVFLPGKRKHRMDHAIHPDIFLGFTATMKNIWYYDTTTNTVKSGQHTTCDEGM